MISVSSSMLAITNIPFGSMKIPVMVTFNPVSLHILNTIHGT